MSDFVADVIRAQSMAESGEWSSFLSEVAALFERSRGGEELHESAKLLLNAGYESGFAYMQCEPQLLNAALAFRESLWREVLSRGDLPQGFCVHLYAVFGSLEPTFDERYNRTINTLQSALEEQLPLEQRLLVVVTLFILRLLAQSPKEALKAYMQELFTTHLHDANSVEYGAKLADEFVRYSRVEAQDLVDIFLSLLEEEHYFSLTHTQRRSIYNWALHVVWNAPSCFNSPHWMRLYPTCKKLFLEHIRRGEMNEAMYLHFYLYHKMGNNFQTQQQFAQFNCEIEAVAAKAYREWGELNNLAECKSHIQSGGKIKLVFAVERLVMNSPFKVEYSLLKAMTQSEEFMSRYEIAVLTMNYFEKSDDADEAIQMLYDIGIHVINPAWEFKSDMYYNDHLKKAVYIREWLLSNGVGVLIACTNNYDILDFLLANRSAPLQLFWSHGNFEYDVPNIDGRFTHITSDEAKNAPFEFSQISLEIDTVFYLPHVSRSDIAAVRSSLPQDAQVIGSIGRLVKIDSDEYLRAVAAILNENPKAVYMACGGGNTQSISQKIKELGIFDRFYFAGHVDAHIYGYAIDLFLDPFPLHSGESLNEYLAKGRAAVVLREPQYANHLKNLEVDERYQKTLKEHEESFFYGNRCLLGLMDAFSVDEYAQRANELLQDEKLREAVANANGVWAALGYHKSDEAHCFDAFLRRFVP